MTIYILMGVAGCGKSTVGSAAAQNLGIPFFEGDDYHSALNIAKMSSGVPLSDDDRMPWVEAIIAACSVSPNEDKILACSSLSKIVRQKLRAGFNGNCEFIHLHGDHITLKQRLSDRSGHFFKTDLLASQFAALHMPRRAITLNIDQPLDTLVQQVCDIIALKKQA